MSRLLISVDRVQVGLYIELPLKWHEHPFLMGKFLIKDNKQLSTLRSLPLKEVWYYPDKSPAKPLETGVAPVVAEPTQEEVRESATSAWAEKKGRLDRLNRAREEISKVEKQYAAVVNEVKDSMYKMKNHPVQAMHESTDLVSKLVESILSDDGALLHLMSPDDLDTGLYYHSLNVSVLSMLLAKSLKLSREQIEVIGCGALLHDIGKIKVPSQILMKTEGLTKAEDSFLQLHTRYGADLIRKYGKLPPDVALIAEQHHEVIDGSGFPGGLKDKQIGMAARIVATVNAYDNLCNHPDIKKSLTPHEALSLMFSKMVHRYDKTVLQCLVRLLGVYPPGTVVELSDGTLGMVMSINQKELLWPSVLLYDPQIPRDEAVIIDLAEDKALTITKSLRPRALKPEVYSYLSPRERVSYFFKQKEGRPAS